MLSWSGSGRRGGKGRVVKNHNCIKAQVCPCDPMPGQGAGSGKGLAHARQELALSQRLDPASGRGCGGIAVLTDPRVARKS